MLINFQKFERFEIKNENNSINFSLYIFILLFVVTVFDRFSSTYLYNAIEYPRIFEMIIERNREIFGILLAALVSISFFTKKIRKFSVSFYWAPIALHFFLSFKFLINGNTEWYVSFFGAISLLVSVYVCTNATRQLFNLDRLVKFSITIVLILVTCAIYQYLMVGSGNMQAGSRFFFFTLHPNSAGVAWAFSAVTVVFLLMHDNLKYQTFKFCILFVCLFFLFLTGSRGSFISCGAGIAAVLYMGTSKNKRNLKIYLFSLILLIVIFLFFSSNINNFYSNQVERGNTRTDVYANAISGFLSFPIFGLPYKSGRPEFVENLILSYMMSAGFFGILFCTAFYYGAVSIIRRSYVKLKVKNDKIPKYFISIFFMMMISSIFESFQISFVTFGSFISIFSATYLIQYVRRPQ